MILCNSASTFSKDQGIRELFWAISRDDTATPPALTACEGPNKIPLSINKLIASIVEGILAPSATTLTPLSINICADFSSSSFWVAQGRAISQGTVQMSVQLS